MHNKTQPTGETAVQANEPRYAPNLEGTVTLFKMGMTWVLTGRFNGQIFNSHSQSESKAVKRAHNWMDLHQTRGM